MLLQIMGLMGAYVAPVAPTLSAVSVATQNTGSCTLTHVGTPAVIRVSATVANADATNFTLKFYKDGVLKSSVGAASGHYDYTVTGFVEGVAGHAFTAAYVFRVDVVRNLDGAVVSTITAPTWREQYGDCSGGQ